MICCWYLNEIMDRFQRQPDAFCKLKQKLWSIYKYSFWTLLFIPFVFYFHFCCISFQSFLLHFVVLWLCVNAFWILLTIFKIIQPIISSPPCFLLIKLNLLLILQIWSSVSFSHTHWHLSQRDRVRWTLFFPSHEV